MLGLGTGDIRLLKPSELAAARAHLERLDTPDQYRHFHRGMTEADFAEWEERASDHDLIGCHAGGRLVGLAEIAYGNGEAELALSVDADKRRRGIGSRLFTAACTRARDRGARYLSVLVSRGDHDMLDLAVRHDGFTVYKRSESRIMPGTPHTLLRWLTFDLSAMPEPGILGEAVRWVRRAMGIDEGKSTRDLSSRD